MGFLEGILYMIWRGIAIGIIISAPMGPVGILCIQRTLDKGRKAGFYTGVGAAISDLIYCLLTGFGLSFIEEFLEKNQNVIQIFGSVVLIGFGIYLFKSNPSKKLKKPSENRVSARLNILNGFLFTVSNPLIIFLIIGLFARFNFLLPEIRFYHYITGFIFIFGGALLWWYLVTLFVDKVRAHFNLRSMWLINKIIGTAIMAFGVFGIITAVIGIADASVREPELRSLYLNKERGFAPLADNDTACFISSGGPVDSARFLALGNPDEFTLAFRCENLHSSVGKRYRYLAPEGAESRKAFPAWQILLKNNRKTVAISINTIDNHTDETLSVPAICFNVSGVPGSSEKTLLKSGFDLYGGENSFSLRYSEGEIYLRGGNREYNPVLQLHVPERFDSIGFGATPGAMIRIDDLSLEYGLPKASIEDTGLDLDSIENKLLNSIDPIEGVWEEFDRSLDESKLRMGGRYRLAIIKAPEGYSIVYLSGAVKNPTLWKRGMVKGTLLKTSFPDVYDIEWKSVGGGKVDGEIKAQREGSVIAIQFPYHNSTLRLRKVEKAD